MDENVFDSEEDIELDHRVKSELEALNYASESINKLENEVQKARNKFRNMKSEASQQLNALYKKIGRRYIIKTHSYYDLVQQCIKIQVEVQKASMNFQKANGMYKAAKETVTLAECQLISEDGHTVKFDSAWQELLNQANLKFGEAEKEKRICEEEHLKKAAEYSNLQQQIAAFQKEIPRAINKAKPFYELKKSLESRLKAERQNAEDLHLALFCSKQKYKMALQNLEQISEQVHQQRQVTFSLPMRTPGVGAESDNISQFSEMPSATLDIMSEAGSTISTEDMLELDFELSLQDLDSTDRQSSDESSFDFWSKISNRLKPSASAAALQTTEEPVDRLGEFNDRSSFVSDEYPDDGERNRRGTIKSNNVVGAYDRSRRSESDSSDSNYGVVRRSAPLQLNDDNADNRRRAIILDKTADRNDYRDVLRRDAVVRERRDTLRLDAARDVRFERRDAFRPADDEDRRKTLTPDDLVDKNNSANYDAQEWRKTLNADDVADKMAALDEMPQREYTAEGAEDSEPTYDSTSKQPQHLIYNRLNEDHGWKMAGKPPVPPFLSSGLHIPAAPK